MPMCPMAEMCKGMMGRPRFGAVMMIPGIVFIAIGVSMIIWPAILVWLVAVACIAAGSAMLVMANLMRGFGSRLR